MVDEMTRSLVFLALLCTTACSEPETPLILDGPRGACGSVVQGVPASEVECPTACPLAVEAFRVRNLRSCERSTTSYVACVSAGGGGRPGAAFLDTEDGPIFVDDPAIDCNREDGCAEIGTETTDRWRLCADTEDDGCDCICRGGECAYDRFVTELSDCGLASPCEPITADAAPTIEQLQCYMDALSEGGPALIQVDVLSTNHLTGETLPARAVIGINDRQAVRLESVSFDTPANVCNLQEANYFLTCDPEEPYDVNITNIEGDVERTNCTDPRGWLLDCSPGEPVCPGG